ncbi:MAG TPA: thiamine pyrophosphate-binding protein [Casimicrobiaceae bacterium]|nr:thiamine pyrophosphate-binding protein [Casimicrobiaceae bacterium]
MNAIRPDSVAGVIARLLKARGVDRVFGLCGGHIMPMWMNIDAAGIGIVDVRDERAAVYMAHAYGELTDTIGVALVTAGPGVTNAMTGIANAHVSRAPVLILSGTPPRAQENRGALQDLAHTDLVRSITRYARTVREPTLAVQELDEAVSRAFGHGAEPGPVYLEFPTDTLRCDVPRALQRDEYFRVRPRPLTLPDPASVQAAADLLWSAHRPLVISGRGARRAGASLVRFLDRLGAPYLDTGETRGIVPDAHPSVVAAMRGTVMTEADVVCTVGRRLDFQLAYGSPAVFGGARFVRVADIAGEMRDNRRGDVELLASCGPALDAIVQAAGTRISAVDRDWIRGLRLRHEERAAKLSAAMRSAPSDASGRIHPNRLLAALQDRIGTHAVAVADGGDFLSFARVGLSASTWLDPGPLGCIGIGTPFGIAAALACPDRIVYVATGDGAFGFNAMEIDTAVRHKAPLLIVVANNAAWQIEVHDQQQSFGKIVGTRLASSDYAAMARAFGMHGERVTHAEDLDGAIERALAKRPALLDVVVTPEAMSSDAKTGLAWVPDLQALAAWDEAERRWRSSSTA